MTRTSKANRIIGWSLAVVFCIPLLYLLSTGPLSFLWRKLGWEKSSIGDAVAAFYSPLNSLVTKSHSPLADGLRAYLRIWGEDVPEPSVDTLAPPAPTQRSATETK